ncbi:MAG: aldehyde dehydrogenase family protein [Anaerolineae bacterium]|nr:aldehyde dehydrogenase family protein [Anaerolineae bacterium]
MAKTKITYTTLSADNEEVHREFEAAVERISAQFGKTYPQYIGAEERTGRPTFESRSPIDTNMVLGNFQRGTREDVQDAIAIARAAYPAWSGRPWQERCDILSRVADMISERVYDLSAAMVLEMGKSRVEALGEVEESADLIRWNVAKMREHTGFAYKMGSFDPAKDENFSVLRPYGVWAVISPFNFPMALAINPAAAALLMGNTVVWKYSSDTPLCGTLVTQLFREAGVPAECLSYVTGGGGSVGAELIDNPGVDGITFTGSYDVGFNMVYKKFAKDYPKPVIVEMGGKNPAIVMPSADLDIAAMGTVRAAFGLDGQKCSACSRVYVHESVKDAFIEKLVATTKRIAIVGDPRQREAFMGPVVNAHAFEDFKRFAAKAKADGDVLLGGNTLTEGEFANGYYVEATIFTGVPEDHELVKTEMFLPILYVGTFTTLEEALDMANDTEYGLTAGIFSQEEDDIAYFYNTIEAGTIYVNRAAGATTGAWPGIQTFGGWKASGTTGKNIGGPHTMQLYGREQSRTRIIG